MSRFRAKAPVGEKLLNGEVFCRQLHAASSPSFIRTGRASYHGADRLWGAGSARLNWLDLQSPGSSLPIHT